MPMVAAVLLMLAAPFADEARSRFAAWDRDGDGALSPAELAWAIHDPATRGASAACAVALRGSGLKSPTLAQVVEEAPRLEPAYRAALRRIGGARRDLFAGEPRLDAIGQGRLGDCYALAGLGALTHADPGRLKRMFEPLPGGRVRVTWGDGSSREFAAPTDGEVCVGARTRNTGVWANCYELAVGLDELSRLKESSGRTPFGRITGGGTPNTPLELITGRFVKRVGCEAARDAADDGARKAALDAIRGELTAAFAAKRLVVGGTGPLPKRGAVPGILYNHSYAVLGFDAARDEVLFWNPIGNAFKPKGGPGLANGYPTSYGRFAVPLAEAVRWFGSFSVETDRPAK
jgi:hypothetical protein